MDSERKNFKDLIFFPFLLPQQPKFSMGFWSFDLWTFLKEDHQRNIPVKVGWTWSMVLEMSFKVKSKWQPDWERSEKITLSFWLRCSKDQSCFPFAYIRSNTRGAHPKERPDEIDTLIDSDSQIFYVLTKYVQSRLLQNCRMRERVKQRL